MSHKEATPFYEKSIQAAKARMLAAERSCYENRHAADRLYSNDEWIELITPLNCKVSIEKNAPVRLLNAITERMDSSKLYAAYARLGRIGYAPKTLLKIMVYGVTASRSSRGFSFQTQNRITGERPAQPLREALSCRQRCGCMTNSCVS